LQTFQQKRIEIVNYSRKLLRLKFQSRFDPTRLQLDSCSTHTQLPFDCATIARCYCRTGCLPAA